MGGVGQREGSVVVVLVVSWVTEEFTEVLDGVERLEVEAEFGVRSRRRAMEGS